LRHDEIIRIRHLEAEIDDMQKDIDRQKQEAAAANERFQGLKKKWASPTRPEWETTIQTVSNWP